MEFTNVYVEVSGKKIPIAELPKKEYEDFLEAMHKLRLVYISVVSRPGDKNEIGKRDSRRRR